MLALDESPRSRGIGPRRSDEADDETQHARLRPRCAAPVSQRTRQSSRASSGLGFTRASSALARDDRTTIVAPRSVSLLAGPSRGPLSLLRSRRNRRSGRCSFWVGSSGCGGGGSRVFSRRRGRLLGDLRAGRRGRERRQLHRSRRVGRELRPVLDPLVGPPERDTKGARSADDDDDDPEEQDRRES